MQKVDEVKSIQRVNGTGSIQKVAEGVLGRKVGGVRVVPLVIKIVAIFTIFLLVSNFASNYINLLLNRGELIRLMNQLLVKDLKEIYVFATNQHEIYFYNQNYEETVKAIEESAIKSLKGQKSIAIGVKPDASMFFQASKVPRASSFEDGGTLSQLSQSLKSGRQEGSVYFRFNREDYFGVYKYIEKWDSFLIRGEELNEFYQDSQRIFRDVSFVILLITIFCALLGIFLIRFILRFVSRITSSLMKMQETQQLALIDLSKAPNDDITYLGISFNALASTIDNLLTIFRKFVTQDVAVRAYREREIRLEGTTKNLTVLFTDIKGFTFMTETLGNDIINLINLHYDRAIRHIHLHDGIVGSIIGDALLAVYGTLDDAKNNKSQEALASAYKILDVAASLRKEMHDRKEEIVKRRGALTEAEERIYRAVLIEVGVGIDGGEVFYGNIGSTERMTNTVIGDNVNSASRLEGLTRVYKVPIVCSDYVKNDLERGSDGFMFLEMDMVQVKGKTEGKRVYWPILKGNIDLTLERDIERFSKGLKAYYEGDWVVAYKLFSECTLPLAEVFRERTEDPVCPKDWNGIWTMKTK